MSLYVAAMRRPSSWSPVSSARATSPFRHADSPIRPCEWRAGKVDQLGTPEELYERPATEFVAGFLGVSNLLDGRVDRVSDGRAEVVLTDGTRVGVPANDAELSAGKDVTIGVRPEKLRIGPTNVDGAADLNTLEGSVIDASYVGVSTQYVVR